MFICVHYLQLRLNYLMQHLFWEFSLVIHNSQKIFQQTGRKIKKWSWKIFVTILFIIVNIQEIIHL